MIAAVIEKAPEQYKAVLTNEQRVQGDQLKLEHLAEVMDTHHTTLYGNGNETSGGNNEGRPEFSLSAFAGVCFYCKERGHKATD